jgi:hypothetical protein
MALPDEILDLLRRDPGERHRVARASARAATLARAGAHALPVVVGDQWATLDTPRHAEDARVAWKVGADLSPGFLALRREASD